MVEKTYSMGLYGMEAFPVEDVYKRQATSLAPCSFLRSSIHSMGGCLGFSRGMAVKCTRAELALAENSTLYAA